MADEQAPRHERDASGRFVKFAGPGRPKGKPSRSVVTTAFGAAGLDPDAALQLLVKRTVEQADKGDREALSRLDRWLMPRERVTPNVLPLGKSAADQTRAVARRLNRGELTPREAGMIVGGTVGPMAEADEFREVERRVAELEARHAAGTLPPAPERALPRPSPVDAVDAELVPSVSPLEPEPSEPAE